MGFTQRFNDAPKLPAMDLTQLIALINDPKKAADLWAKYQEVHAAYETEMAEVKRMTAEIEKAQKVLWQDNFDLEDEQKKFDEQVKNKTEQLRKLEQTLEDTRKQNELTSMGLSDKYKSLQDWQYTLDHREEAIKHQSDLNQQAAFREDKRLKELAEVLEKREAAVAEREAKAKEILSKLKEF